MAASLVVLMLSAIACGGAEQNPGPVDEVEDGSVGTEAADDSDSDLDGDADTDDTGSSDVNTSGTDTSEADTAEADAGEAESGEASTGDTDTGDAETDDDSGDSGDTNDTSVDEFVPCTIDVSNVGASCSSTDPTTCDGADIAQNHALWPDPYECFVCSAGVTLLKGSACENQGVELIWNAMDEQCILNGQGYPMTGSHTCSSGKFADGVTPTAYAALIADWYQIAIEIGTAVPQPNAGADAYVVDVTLEDGTQVEAAMSMGHGVLDGKCGSTFLVKLEDKYVLLLQTDIRAWSLELSPGANTWLDDTNVGGTCFIPDVRRIESSFVIDQFLSK